jgi:hypothetical protein
LDVDLAGVLDYVSVGQDALAVYDDPGAFNLLGAIFSPRAEQIRRVLGRMDFHDQVANLILGVGAQCEEGIKQYHKTKCQASAHGDSFVANRALSREKYIRKGGPELSITFA